MSCARGFAADSGDPTKAKILFIWEAPGEREVEQEEAAVGPTGGAFNGWLKKCGTNRNEVVVANTIRSRFGNNDFPGGDLRGPAVQACRHWDDAIIAYSPDVWGVSYHPSAAFRTPQWRLYIMRAIERSLVLREQGHRPAILCGNEAMNAFLPHLKGGVGRWKCHFEEGRYGDVWKKRKGPFA